MTRLTPRSCLRQTYPVEMGLLQPAAYQLEDPLKGVLVEAQKASDGSISKLRFRLDHLCDRRRKSILNIRFGFYGLVADRTPRNIEPITELRNRNGDAAFSKAPPDLKDHVSSFLPSRASNFFGRAVKTTLHSTLPAGLLAVTRTARGCLLVLP
jgi:hypothetical protein